MSESPVFCRNCQAPLAGEYCSQCGQREGRGDLRFIDLASEVLGDFLTWDSRVWRTLLSLLFRPGHLTAEFIAGRRARYLPPLRLYLIISFLVFLAVSFGAGGSFTVQGVDVRPDEPASAGEVAEAAAPEDADRGNRVDIADENSPPWLKDLDQRMEHNVEEIERDPDAFVQLLLDYLPQMMFLLLPLFALLLWLCYALSPFHYLQHLVFGLHYHSFVYIWFLLDWLLERFGWHPDIVLLLLLVYLPLALRRCYGSGWGGALFKSFFIYVSYGISLAVSFGAMALATLALM